MLRLLELLKGEPAIDSGQTATPAKPRREPPAENEEERTAKRAARERRG